MWENHSLAVDFRNKDDEFIINWLDNLRAQCVTAQKHMGEY